MYFFTLIFATVLLSVQAQNLAQSSAQSSAQSYARSNGQNQMNPQVYRPCPNFNPACISQWLARNSYCRVPNAGVAREPLYSPVRQVELPSINTTLFRYDIRYTNVLNGRIEEFFVDYVNGYTVLSIDYTDLTVNVGEARYEQNRRANIPLVEITPTQLIYSGVAITTVFPATNGLNLANARSTAFLDQLPNFESEFVGPVQQANIDNIATTGIEAFITASPNINRLFIQNVLCDFGIQINQLGLSN